MVFISQNNQSDVQIGRIELAAKFLPAACNFQCVSELRTFGSVRELSVYAIHTI